MSDEKPGVALGDQMAALNSKFDQLIGVLTAQAQTQPSTAPLAANPPELQTVDATPPAPTAPEGSSLEDRVQAIEAALMRYAPVVEELLSTGAQITGGSIGSVLTAAAKALGHL